VRRPYASWVPALRSWTTALALAACGAGCGLDERLPSNDAGNAEAGSKIDAGSCAPPNEAGRSALCLVLEPEAMDFESNPRRDGRGVLFVQIFDRQVSEPLGGGFQPPIAVAVYPELAPGQTPAEISLLELTPLRFDDLPETVYVRVMFSDAFGGFPGGSFSGSGMWVGGYDFSDGFFSSLLLRAIALPAGRGTAHVEPLRALRRLHVQLELDEGVIPLDDGQGPATILAFREPNLSPSNALHGFAGAPCVTVSASRGADLEGMLIGSGDFYLFGQLNDFNRRGGTGQVIPGGLGSVKVGDGGLVDGGLLSLSDKITLRARQYSVDAEVVLRQVFPVPGGDAGAGYSCRLLGGSDAAAGRDGGTDAD
jgi:hypothetical protein